MPRAVTEVMNSADWRSRQVRTTPTTMGISRRPRVVVADAHPDVRSALHALLRERGFEVVLAGEGMAAARRASESDAGLAEGASTCDLLISDAELPGRNGLELLQMAGDLRWATPVVLMVPAPSAELATRAQRLGAAAVLTKPIRGEELDRVLAQLGLTGG
jgi:DNA-binding response OmpR family regulator